MELQVNLGQRLVAYATGTRSPQAIGRWARGDDVPDGKGTEERLRALYSIYLILRGPAQARIEEPATIRTWLVSANSHLGDEPPLEFLRNGNPLPAQLAARDLVRD